MDIEKWYKHAVESNHEDPPEALWDSIQDDLDVSDVWTRLEGSLSQTRKIPLWVFRAAAASIALLIGFSAWFLWFGKDDSVHQAPPILVQQKVEEENSEAPAVASLGKRPGLTHSEPKVIAHLGKRERELTIDLASAGSKTEKSRETEEMAEFKRIEKQELPALPEQPSGLKESPKTLADEFLASLDPEPLNTRFSIGILGQFANTWLLNPKTFQGLQSQELTATNATFGKNFGLSFMKPLGIRTSLKGELMILSQSRQNYMEYLSGQYTPTSLRLDYRSLSMMLSLSPLEPGSPHSLQLGAYVGTLIQAREVSGQNNLIVRDEYAKTDFGLIGGYEYFIPVSSNVFIGTGFFAKYGLTNVFYGNQQIPDYLNRTHNAPFIFSLSVNYSIK